MDTIFASDTLPLESVTVAVKVIVPDKFRNPVVSVEAVPEYPHPERTGKQLYLYITSPAGDF